MISPALQKHFDRQSSFQSFIGTHEHAPVLAALGKLQVLFPHHKKIIVGLIDEMFSLMEKDFNEN